MWSIRSGFIGVFALALAAGGSPAVAMQDAPAASFPATIVAGTCDNLDQEAIVQLADVTYGLGEDGGEAGIPGAMELLGPTETALVATGVTRLDMTPMEIVEGPHSVAVFETAEATAQNAIACGPIGGIAPEDNLFFGLREQNQSGYAGIGWLNTTGDTTLLTVMLTSLEATTSGAGALATAVATDDDVTVLTEDAATPDAVAPVVTDDAVEETTPVVVMEATPDVDAELPIAEATPAEAMTETPAVATPAAMAASPAAGGATDDAAAETVTIESVDIDFIPEEVTIPADTDVTIELPNNGAILHNFSLDEKNNENLPIEPISIDIQPGESEQTTVNLPAGEYYFYCNIPGHEAAGMFGTLIVE